MAFARQHISRVLHRRNEAGPVRRCDLAAGLDSRSWRYPGPMVWTVYELDQPKVSEFKLDVLRHRGAQHSTSVNVRIDLRQDMANALRSGF